MDRLHVSMVVDGQVGLYVSFERHHVDLLDLAVTVTSSFLPEMMPMVIERCRKKA
jgi:hypothetical protein